jgi:hypothetical protein
LQKYLQKNRTFNIPKIMKNLISFLLFFILTSSSMQAQTTLSYSGTVVTTINGSPTKPGVIAQNFTTVAPGANLHVGLVGNASNGAVNVGLYGTTVKNTVGTATKYFGVLGDNFYNSLNVGSTETYGGYFGSKNSGASSQLYGSKSEAEGLNNTSTTIGVEGIATNNSNTIGNRTIGVRGISSSGNSSTSVQSGIANPGGFFSSNDGQGLYATTSGGYTFTGFGEVSQAVVGVSNLTGIYSNTGVTGYGNGSSSFKFGVSGYINGTAPTGVSAAIYGVDNINTSATYGGFFQGKVRVTNNLLVDGYAQIVGFVYAQGGLTTTGTKNFTIDHPLDPENKILRHASIESNEVLNQYSGNITTDSKGNATVILPTYFEVLNKDFRYQLTVMGSFAQAIIKKEVSNNQFIIKSNQPNIKVSWQITGVRNDRNMQYAPFVAETEKEEKNKGKYLSPEAFGKPKSQGEMVANNVQGEVKNSGSETDKK